MPKVLFPLAFCMALATDLHSQGGLSYPAEEYFGGGIGYTPTFLIMDLGKSFPFVAEDGIDLLGDTGLDFSDDDIKGLKDVFVIHGAEGFGNITGNWRLGAYVGLGTKTLSANLDSLTKVSLDLSLMMASVSAELVIPIFSNLELAAGALFGVSRATMQISRKSSDQLPDWKNQFTGPDSSNMMSHLSGAFFSFQPYAAVKLQFLDRVGLRISAGYNVGTLGTDEWTLNRIDKIKAPSKASFNAPAVRVMLYMGI